MSEKGADDLTSSPDNLLVTLKNKIMLKLNIDHHKLKYLIQNFVKTAFNSTAGAKIHYTIINLTNELTSPKMTIKVFFKFLNIIRIKKITFNITLLTITDREVTITEEINLSTLVDDPEADNVQKR